MNLNRVGCHWSTPLLSWAALANRIGVRHLQQRALTERRGAVAAERPIKCRDGLSTRSRGHAGRAPVLPLHDH